MSEVRNKKKIKIRQRFRKIEMSEWVQSCKGADHHSRYCFDLIHSFQNHPNRTFTFTSSTTYRARKYKPTHEQDTEDMRENRHKRMEHLPFLLSIESTKPGDYATYKTTYTIIMNAAACISTYYFFYTNFGAHNFFRFCLMISNFFPISIWIYIYIYIYIYI